MTSTLMSLPGPAGPTVRCVSVGVHQTASPMVGPKNLVPVALGVSNKPLVDVSHKLSSAVVSSPLKLRLVKN